MYEGTERHGEWFLSQMATANASERANPNPSVYNPIRWDRIDVSKARAAVAVHYRRNDWSRELSDVQRANEWSQRAYDARGRARHLNAARATYVPGCPLYAEAQAWNKLATYLEDELSSYGPWEEED